MTLSADTQRRERHALLAGMLADVGDLGFDRPVFRVDQWSEIHLTTWLSLQQAGTLRALDSGRYKLTPQGWLDALRETGAFESDATRERCIRLKQIIKARTDAEPMSPHVFFHWMWQTPDDLPTEWVMNALLSRLLQEQFPNEIINHEPPADLRGPFCIPANFGRKVVKFDDSY